MGEWSGHIWSVANVGDRLVAVGGSDDALGGAFLIMSSDGRGWEETHRVDDARSARLHRPGGPTVAGNGSSVLVLLRLSEPDGTMRAPVLLRAPLP